jgi:hypothetical protein
VQQVVGHSQATACRAVPARKHFERAGWKECVAVMRVRDADVCQGTGDDNTGRECGRSSTGPGFSHVVDALEGPEPCR